MLLHDNVVKLDLEDVFASESGELIDAGKPDRTGEVQSIALIDVVVQFIRVPAGGQILMISGWDIGKGAVR